MRIKFDVDLTPKEARQLLGLPDLEPIQKEMLEELESILRKNMSLIDTETVLKSWFSGGQALQDRWMSMLKGVASSAKERSSGSRAAKASTTKKSRTTKNAETK